MAAPAPAGSRCAQSTSTKIVSLDRPVAGWASGATCHVAPPRVATTRSQRVRPRRRASRSRGGRSPWGPSNYRRARDHGGRALLARGADDHTGLRFEDVHVDAGARSWRSAGARARMLAALRRPGPFHVGVLLENVPEYLFLLGRRGAGRRHGGGHQPHPPRAPSWRATSRHTDCQLIVTDDRPAAAARRARHRASGRDRVLVVDDPGVRRGVATPAPVRRPRPGPGGADHGPRRHPGPTTLYLLLFTSGSTGAPKAVRVTQGRMASQAGIMAAGSGFGPGDVMYCAMPMFHGNALNTCVVPGRGVGGDARAAPPVLGLGLPPRRPALRRHLLQLRGPGARLRAGHARPPPTTPTTTLRFGFGTDALAPRHLDVQAALRVSRWWRATDRARGPSPCRAVPGTPRQALGTPAPGTDVVVLDPATGIECAVRRHSTPTGMLRNASEAIGEIVSRDGVSRFEGYYANAEADAERTRQGLVLVGRPRLPRRGGLLLLRRAHVGLAAGGRRELRRRTRRADPGPLPRCRDGRGLPRARPPHRGPGHGGARAVGPGRFDPDAFARFLWPTSPTWARSGRRASSA